ncbi:ABC transporter permease [Streptomyces natalensis]|uniref:ABC transporter substrate-binding protein n=1 Tax=Streptomyces natalensis ATCC 27448 TaxID=1240678 RepID=A0A0D7CHE3_9ACTN|nr:FtsX-like permease family protein [Streptomyces natalensis]KIZ14822.1 ABC transporter substrate-binding protein [Streptomyces natalensis ATCC 27448]
MFVAWRDLRFAKGRFALMGTVIVLITMLVGLLSGLTAGLGRENTSAITALPVDHLVFSAPVGDGKVAFTDSRLPQRTVREWARVPGVRSAEPLGIATTKAQAGSRTAAVSAFGVRPGSRLGPGGTSVADGSVVLSQKAAQVLGIRAGDAVTLGGRAVEVAAVSGAAMYSHTAVIWTSLEGWRKLTGGPGGATVVALTTTGAADLPAADKKLGTRTVTADDALKAIGSYSAENGSLQLMRGFLFAISALVIGAFFTVWTIQRSGDVAVLKALGASTRSLLRDALGQAVVLLVIGTGLGTAVAAGVGALVGGTVPFVLDGATVLIPALVMIALGAVGAALSIRRITSVDPLTALGSAR